MKTTAHIFKALAEETRLRILNLLWEGELCVCDLMALLNLPQSTVSRHLAYLRNCGLITDRRQGVWMYYHLTNDLDDFQQQLLKLLERQLASLEIGRQDRAALRQRRQQTSNDCCNRLNELPEDTT